MSGSIRRLEYFLAVAEELNFTRAAEALHIAQSALSRQIRLFEHDLGTPLLIRTTHSVSLTAAGDMLKSAGPRLVRDMNDLWAEVRRVGNAERRQVSFAYTTSCGFETAPRVVDAVRSRMPDLAITTQLAESAAMIEGIRSGVIDVGLARHLDRSEGLERHVVRREREGVLMLADDPLGAQAEVRADQLSERRILLHPRAANEAHYDHVVELCRRAGFEPMVLDRSVAFDPANLPITDGRAIAIVGESVTISIAESMVWRPLADPFASFDVYLIVTPERRRPANATFIRHARAYAAEIGWI